MFRKRVHEESQGRIIHAYMNAIQTTHNLDFGACPWPLDLTEAGIMAYRIGTCHGIYQFDDDGISIIAIHNDTPGNGHLEDVFQWFEFSAQAQKKDLYIRRFFNPQFKQHCITKRGFREHGQDDVFKKFT
jgi:hypothetical protein